jgi:hypothetical protein
MNVKHTTGPSYNANWVPQPPADSYGSFVNGEFAANPMPVWMFICQRYLGNWDSNTWLSSFTPMRGGVILVTNSSTATWVGGFIEKGGCAGVTILSEPYSDGVPEVEAFMRRLLEGMTIAEASILSTPKGEYQLCPVGDPLYRPFGKNGNSMRVTRAR